MGWEMKVRYSGVVCAVVRGDIEVVFDGPAGDAAVGRRFGVWIVAHFMRVGGRGG